MRTIMFINLSITTTPVSHQCTMTHISHPTMILTMRQLHSLNGFIQASLNQTLSHRFLFHQFRITVMSALIPSDRTLKITLDNTIHTLTPHHITSVDIQHYLHLYLNPHNSLSYLQYIRDVNEHSTQCLIFTTTLLHTRSGTTLPRRQPVMRTTTHTPALVTIFTFPADYIQH